MAGVGGDEFIQFVTLEQFGRLFLEVEERQNTANNVLFFKIHQDK